MSCLFSAENLPITRAHLIPSQTPAAFCPPPGLLWPLWEFWELVVSYLPSLSFAGLFVLTPGFGLTSRLLGRALPDGHPLLSSLG